MVNRSSHCMKRRLLYAASQAYRPRMEVAGRAVGWLEPPRVVRRALPATGRAIDLALVGRVAEGVVVAFRGALPPFAGEGDDGWAELIERMHDGGSEVVADAAYPGSVHAGFAASMMRLWADLPADAGVHSLVQTALERGRRDGLSRAHLFATGHGKGGALANLFAMRAAAAPEWLGVPISVTTIGAARVGDAAFAAAYGATRIACLRYEAAGDVVPVLPPGRDTPGFVRSLARHFAPGLTKAEWRAVGTRIAAEGGHARLPGMRRVLPRLLGQRGAGEALVPEMLGAHAIGPGSPYDRLICGGEAACDHGAASPVGLPLRRAAA